MRSMDLVLENMCQAAEEKGPPWMRVMRGWVLVGERPPG